MISKRMIISLFVLLSGFTATIIYVYANQQLSKRTPVLTDAVYKFEKENDWDDRWRGVCIEVHYPQIQGGSDADDITNIALRDTAFSLFDGLEEPTYEEVLRSFEEESKDLKRIDIVKIEYEVLHCTRDYVSVIFSVEAENGARLYNSRYVAAINVKTGQYIHLQDIMDLEQLAQALMDNQFEVYAGTYFMFDEEDAYDPQNIVKFINDFEEGLAKQKDTNQYYGDRKYSNVDQHYYRSSCKNIGMDEEGIYIYFTDDMAFEGYFIFRIPWEYIDV